MYLDLNQKTDYYGGAYKRFVKGEYHVTRFNRTDILILMLGGTLYFSEDGREVTVSRGEYYIQQDKLHQTSSRPSDDAYYIYLDFKGVWCESGMYGLPLRGSFDIEKIYRLADHLCRVSQSRNQPLLSNAKVFYEILEILFYDNRRLDDRLLMAGKIHEYISENCTKPIDITAVAERFSYTPDYVIRVFKRAYGITPHNYLTNCRIEYAKLLLLNTDRPIAEVAETCGYTDFTTFFRAFRARTKRSPKEWRNEQRSCDNIV